MRTSAGCAASSIRCRSRSFRCSGGSPRKRTVLHVIPQVFLDGRWLTADPLFDRRFFEGLKRRDVEALRAVESIDWDGTSDQSPQEQWVKRELGVCANADEIITEWTRHVRYLYYVGAFYPFEHYINRVRQG